MPIEHERKFVLSSDDWRAESTGQVEIEQRYLVPGDDPSIRIRRADGKYLLTVKAWAPGGSRPEHEFEVPDDVGPALMDIGGRPVLKTRHLLDRTPHKWTVDVFAGESTGLVMLEIEDDTTVDDAELPPWVTPDAEVTSELKYRNAALAERPFQHWANTVENVKRPRDGTLRMRTEPGRSVEDWRTEVHTDVDRIWYAPEFRRLSGITQVVPPQSEYLFHDRLLHSIKVAQVAATLARMLHYHARHDEELRAALRDHEIDLSEWISPEHCYAAGLAHDIGHPPYGHAGENTLQDLHKSLFRASAHRSFEGNAQSMRIVSALSFRKAPEPPGLNLTVRTLAAIAKYPWEVGRHPKAIDKLKEKWSFYESERPVLKALEDHGFIRTVHEKQAKPTPLPSVLKVYRWIEAEIMDWADDISYAVHDIEDFYRGGRIPLHRIQTAFLRAPQEMRGKPEDEDGSVDLELWRTTDFKFAEPDDEVFAALHYAKQKMEKVRDQDGRSLAEHIPQAFETIVRRLVWRIPGSHFDGSRRQHAALQNFGSAAITYLSKSASIEIVQLEDGPRVQLRVDPVAQLVAEFFKAICKFFVINTAAVTTMQRGQASSLERLCTSLHAQVTDWQDGGRADPDVHTLPARLGEYLRLIQETKSGSITDAARCEAIIDYVCGLRDVQATILDARLTGDLSSLSIAADWLDA